MIEIEIYFVNFRLGEEFAHIYEEFKVNTSKIKSFQRIEMIIETKRKNGVIYAEEISQSCTEIINSISNFFQKRTLTENREHRLFVQSSSFC